MLLACYEHVNAFACLTVPPGRVEMKNLPERVNSCVGPAAAVNPHRLAEDLREPAFDHILHADALFRRLALPSRK